MILEVLTVTTIRQNGKPIPGRRITVKCDHCGCIFHRKYLQKYVERTHHACSRSCSNRSEHMKQQSRMTCIERFGVENASQSSIVKQHAIETVMKKYGVRYPCEIPHVKASHCTPEVRLKRHKTKCKNGSYRRSKPEIELGEILGKNIAIKSQAWLDPGFSIDFYMPDLNCYVQLDGVHWHMLSDRKLGSSKHDLTIMNKFKKDRELDGHVKRNGMRLIRVTDVHYKICSDEIAGIILSKAKDPSWQGVHFMGEHYEKLHLTS